MSLASMLASAERLSKNLERKMSKPILKNESKVNANDMQIKKVPKMVHAATVRIFLKISIFFPLPSYSSFLI